MITLTLAAKHIPDETLVRKPTGTTYYLLRRKIKIYGEGGRDIYPPQGVVWLVSQDSTSDSGVFDDKKLSVDFEHPDDAARWIDNNFEEFADGD